jgi:hypothetical protein
MSSSFVRVSLILHFALAGRNYDERMPAVSFRLAQAPANFSPVVVNSPTLPLDKIPGNHTIIARQFKTSGVHFCFVRAIVLRSH